MEILYKPNYQIHSNQVADCLATIGHLMGWLKHSDSEPVEGHVQTSLEATIIRACNRLDTIFDDETRWQLPKEDAHHVAQDSACLNNAMAQAQLHKMSAEREMVMQKIAGVANLLNSIKKAPPTKPSRTPKKKDENINE
jgi:hypothetical protein